jgi:hypothetical protein
MSAGVSLRPPWPALFRRRGDAQASAIFKHSHTLPQGNGDTGPTLAGSAVSGECNLIVFDAVDQLELAIETEVIHSAIAASHIVNLVFRVIPYQGYFFSRSPAPAVQYFFSHSSWLNVLGTST